MKKIFESEFNGFDDGESVTRVHVYELDNVDEFWKFEHMNFDKKCNYFGVRNYYNVAPGARFYTYEFDVSRHHIIMYETISLNI